MAGLFFLYIASLAAAAVGGILLGKKETIDRSHKDNTHDDTDNNNYKELYIHLYDYFICYNRMATWKVFTYAFFKLTNSLPDIPGKLQTRRGR